MQLMSLKKNIFVCISCHIRLQLCAVLHVVELLLVVQAGWCRCSLCSMSEVRISVSFAKYTEKSERNWSQTVVRHHLSCMLMSVVFLGRPGMLSDLWW